MRQLPPRMAPVLLWETGLFLQHLALQEVSQAGALSLVYLPRNGMLYLCITRV